MNQELGIKKIFLALTIFGLMFAPIVFAQQQNVNKFLPACKPTEVLDPPQTNLKLPVTDPNHRCNVYDILQLVVNLTRWLWYMSIPLAGALFLYAGYLIMTAAGDEGQVGQGKKIITAAVVGFIIVMTSWLLVRTIFYILAPGYTGGLSQ